jgi:dynein heavy chain 2
MASYGKKGEEKDRAQFFSEVFQKQIAPRFGSMATMSMSDVMDLVEETQDTLDDIWKQTDFDKPYPETRMKRLLEVIGSYLSLPQ